MTLHSGILAGQCSSCEPPLLGCRSLLDVNEVGIRGQVGVVVLARVHDAQLRVRQDLELCRNIESRGWSVVGKSFLPVALL